MRITYLSAGGFETAILLIILYEMRVTEMVPEPQKPPLYGTKWGIASKKDYPEAIPTEVEDIYDPDDRNCYVGKSAQGTKHLYTVITEKGQFYVGITSRNPMERWKEHLGVGEYPGADVLQDKEIAAFVLVATDVENAEEAENQLTLQMMAKHGIKNVTGGDYAVDKSPNSEFPTFSNPDEYDFLADVDLESRPLPIDEAHSSVVVTSDDRNLELIDSLFTLIKIAIISAIVLVVLSFILTIIYLILVFIYALINEALGGGDAAATYESIINLVWFFSLR